MGLFLPRSDMILLRTNCHENGPSTPSSRDQKLMRDSLSDLSHETGEGVKEPQSILETGPVREVGLDVASNRVPGSGNR